MLKIFIERPVLSTVISILIVVLGIIGLTSLPVEQYPNIAPPTVQISATYPGANADVVMNNVIVPLEEQINGVEGMTYMQSSATNDGAASIRVFFRQGIDPDIAAVNVQNLVARATPLLPQEVTQTGVLVQKMQNGTILGISFASTNPDYDAIFLQNYANINIIPQIKRVYGVGGADPYGANDYSMRIWLKPDVMASYGISAQEVVAALRDQNIDAAPGMIGQNSDQSFQYTLKFTGRLTTSEEFGNVIISSRNGQILRVKDLAEVELGARGYTSFSLLDGEYDALYIGVSQTSGSNAQQVIEDVKAVIAEAEKSFPEGLSVRYAMDASEFLDASIDKVTHTMIEAFFLVVLVVLVFLQNFRSTVIPAIAVPVSIIGAFFFLQLFGFSINLLTLFALILAIGIVVDDAIIVVEAVHVKLDAGAKNAKEATLLAMGEIAPAIISMSLVMAAVFVPVSFIGGTTGIFFQQFGLTLAVAILISAVNALTLSPALSALFLKPHLEEESKKKKRTTILDRFYRLFNTGFDWVTEKYRSTLRFMGKKQNRWITIFIIVVTSGLFLGLMRLLPTGFVPLEDSGGVVGFVTLPPGSSLERTTEVAEQVNKLALNIEGVKNTTTIYGNSFLSGADASYATVIILMDNWGKRKTTTNDVVQRLTKETSSINNATFFFMARPTLQGFGLGAGVDMVLQDRTGGDVNRFFEVTQNFVAQLNQRPEVMRAMTTFNPNFPQKMIEADVAKIKDAGLTLTEVMNTLQVNIGSSYISNFNIYGKQGRVMVQAAPDYRKNMDDLKQIFVKTGSGQMAPITEFLTITDVTQPRSLERFNMFSSMNVTIMPNMIDGCSSGDVLQVIREMANDKSIFPEGYSYEYGGMTREEARGDSQLLLIFGLCIVFVYLLLSALYESYILPMAVLLSLPVGLSGVFVFLLMFGVHQGIVNNIYVQISMVMLIGILAKNAILIVEYAVQRRKQGMSIIDAAIEGAVARLRPILMTSFAFIAGLSPLFFATGAGAVGNRSIGISAIGGMTIGTIVGVLVIPSLYIVFQNLQEKMSNK